MNVHTRERATTRPDFPHRRSRARSRIANREPAPSPLARALARSRARAIDRSTHSLRARAGVHDDQRAALRDGRAGRDNARVQRDRARDRVHRSRVSLTSRAIARARSRDRVRYYYGRVRRRCPKTTSFLARDLSHACALESIKRTVHVSENVCFIIITPRARALIDVAP